MEWKVMRIELASSWQYPRGSAGRSYLIRLPLTEEGSIDTAALQSQPRRATVRRYWPNEADMVGHLVQTPTGYAIRYEAKADARHIGEHAPDDACASPLFGLGATAFKVGEEVFLTEPDGLQVRYRIANLQ
jgi:hypothetical protein